MEALLSFNRVARALQFIVSVSSISFLFAYLSSLYSSSGEPLHECLFALLASDFSAGDRFVDKKMVFLLCNGIILCVSWLPGSGSYSAHNLQEDGFVVKPAAKPSFDEKLIGRESGTTGSSLKVVADLEMDPGQIEGQEHDEEGGGEGKAVSEEESDERFENFIRKMREQIGIVSLPQDVVVPENIM